MSGACSQRASAADARDLNGGEVPLAMFYGLRPVGWSPPRPGSYGPPVDIWGERKPRSVEMGRNPKLRGQRARQEEALALAEAGVPLAEVTKRVGYAHVKHARVGIALAKARRA